MKTKLLFVIVLLNTFLLAQEFKKNATAGFVFLELPVNARTAALGEASITLSDVNASGVFSNPAALGFTNQTHSFSASYSPWIADIKHYASSYAFKSELGVFAIGLIAMDFGSMPKTKKISGQRVYEILGTFDAKAIAASINYSKQLTDRFSFGVSLKYVEESIDIYSADNILFDAGILYYTGLGSFRIGAVMQNFGKDVKYLNDPFKMPTLFKLGLASDVFVSDDSDFRITALAEAIHPNDGDERVSTGLEFSWQNMITLRGGYKFFFDEETYSFGVGFNPQLSVPASIDFSYSDYGRLGNVLRFSLQLGLL
jgi:hypothetical protein